MFGITFFDTICPLQVRSTSSGSSKGIQVSTSASSLNSNDAFVLKGETECYVWMGKGANDTEIDAAKYIAGASQILLKRPCVFWRPDRILLVGK